MLREADTGGALGATSWIVLPVTDVRRALLAAQKVLH